MLAICPFSSYSCIVGMIPLLLIFIFLCIIILGITVLLGDGTCPITLDVYFNDFRITSSKTVCTVAFDRSAVPPPLDVIASAYLDADMVSLIPTVFEALDICGGGASLVEVALMYKDTIQQFLPGFNMSEIDISERAKGFIDDFTIPDFSNEIDVAYVVVYIFMSACSRKEHVLISTNEIQILH